MPYKNKQKQKEYQQTHYLKNKDKYKKKSRESWRKTRDIISRLKEKPCVDCGVQYPYYVMQFDHLPQHEKVDAVYTLVRTKGRKAALEEIKKCELVCANCHAIRTFKRTNKPL